MTDTPAHNFGSCCDNLKEAMAGEDFEPLITVGDEGVLYMTVGLIDLEEEDPALVDHPLLFCPFCGTSLQDKDAVAKIASETPGSDTPAA